MADLNVAPFGKSVDIIVPANGTFAAWSTGAFTVMRLNSGNNQPAVETILNTTPANGVEFNSGVLSTTVSTTLRILADGGVKVDYAVNSASATADATQIAHTRGDRLDNSMLAPSALNATGALTGGAILNGVVSSTTAAAVAATLDTGTVMDTVSSFNIGDAWEWSVINTGPNTFTVTAAAGHTLLGQGAVLTTLAAKFKTRKTAAATFITTRIAG